MKKKGKFNFLNLNTVILRHFSLYSKNGEVIEVNEKINKGVYCLAGANGLGKTTFLNAINYGLTGIVLGPGKEVLSPHEVRTEHKRYTERYFNGRIKKKDLQQAEIELRFTVNNKNFRIVRGFKNREKLRELEVYTKEGDKKLPTIDGSELSPRELNLKYEEILPDEIGIKNFEYFIFFQLYILTFDEHRRMVFWDERASSHALSIAFNTNIYDADKLIDLKRRMEKHESNARNARWQATQIKNEIKTLKKAQSNSRDEKKLKEKYDELHRRVDEAEKVFRNISKEYDSLLKKQSYLNSEIMQFKMEHARLFSKYSKPRSKLFENPVVANSIDKNKCVICDTSGSQIGDKITSNLHQDKCPLCETSIDKKHTALQDKLLNEIRENDVKISQKNEELENLTLEVNGKKTEVEKAEHELNKAKENLNSFLNEHSEVSFEETGDESIDVLIKQHRKQFEKFDKKSKEEYKKRDKLKPEYGELLDEVESAYQEAEIKFVPIFKELAQNFIGLNINVHSERSSKNIHLVLEMEDTARTEAFQLSESQRFFLDIALRMALAIYLSKPKQNATMLIDTPEGSLDIAYESRVGKMFGNFVNKYNQNILMTANINASQLLVALASECGHENMSFKRIFDWTDPTSVQKEGEHLFDEVYKNIDKALENSETN